MNRIVILFCLILLVNNLFSLFTDLTGGVDNNGNPILFYRYHGEIYDPYEELTYDVKNIQKYDINSQTENLFLSDYHVSYIEGNYPVDVYVRIRDFQYLSGFYCYLKSVYIIDGLGNSSFDMDFYSKDENGTINSFDFDNALFYLSFSISNPNLIYVSAYNYFFKSNDCGMSWLQLNDQHDLPYRLWNTSPFNDQIVFSSNADNLYKSTDGAVSFSLVNTPSEIEWNNRFIDIADYETNTVNPSKMIFGSDDYIYTVAQGDLETYVVISSDNGENWSIVYTSTLPLYLSEDLSILGAVYLSEGSTIYKSENFGNTFEEIYQLSEEISGIYKKPNSELIYAISYTNGLFEISPAGINTLIEPTSIYKQELTPIQYILENYPNPFNPSTTIEFSIRNVSNIEVSIYNIKGQKIKSLANNEFNKGSHSIIWNGDDESGKTVSSGIYYYQLIVNGKPEAVKKCLLLK